jgi:hypothetical protein
MSMLSLQIKELREKAEMLDGLEGMDNLVRMLREAADTIESLRNTLQELQGVGGESRYTALFGTPERAAQLIADNCEFLSYCGQCWIRAASCDGKYSTVLEWLRGDAE